MPWPKAIYGRKSLFWLMAPEEEESIMAEKHGRKGQVWWQGQKTENSHSYQRHKAERIMGTLEKLSPNDILLQAGPHLLNLPKKCHQLGTSVQIPKPMLNIFHLNKHANTKKPTIKMDSRIYWSHRKNGSEEQGSSLEPPKCYPVVPRKSQPGSRFLLWLTCIAG